MTTVSASQSPGLILEAMSSSLCVRKKSIRFGRRGRTDPLRSSRIPFYGRE